MTAVRPTQRPHKGVSLLRVKTPPECAGQLSMELPATRYSMTLWGSVCSVKNATFVSTNVTSLRSKVGRI